MAFVLAAGMEPFDDLTVALLRFPGHEITVDGGIGDAHLLLVRLTVEETGGGSFLNNAAGRVQILQKLEDFRRCQVTDGIEVMGTVAPLGEVSHICLAGVAGTGHQTSFCRCHGIQRGHAQTGGDVGDGKIRHLGDGGQLIQFLLPHFRQVDDAGLDVKLLRNGVAVVLVQSKVAF